MATKVKESVEQMKKQRAIEHMQIAISDLQRYQSAPVVINTLVGIHDSLAEEYNEMFVEEVAEPESAHPTIAKGKDKEKL